MWLFQLYCDHQILVEEIRVPVWEIDISCKSNYMYIVSYNCVVMIIYYMA